MRTQRILIFSGLIVIVVLISMMALSWSTTPSTTISTPNIDATVKAEVAYNRGVETTVEPRLREEKSLRSQQLDKLGASESAKEKYGTGAKTKSETAGSVAVSVNAVGETLTFDTLSFSAESGTEITITFNNLSSNNLHNLVIVQDETKDAVAADGTAAGPANDWVTPGDYRVITNTALIEPGGSGKVTFTAPPAGTYQFVCTFPGHNFTMFGDFHVSEEPIVRPTPNPSPSSFITPAPPSRPTPIPTPNRIEQATAALYHYDRGELLRTAGNCEQAISEYDQAIKIDFKKNSRSVINRNAHFFKGYCHGEIGQYAIARLAYGVIESETYSSVRYAITGPEPISPALVYFNQVPLLYKLGISGEPLTDYYTTALLIDQLGGCQYMCGMTYALTRPDLLEQIAP